MTSQPQRRLRFLNKQLLVPASKALDIACDEAKRADVRLFLVGGAVRDLLLGSEVSDVDMVVEGQAIPLARATARRLGARIKTHERFGTGSVIGSGFRLDFANARTERYPRPGALPMVEPSTLDEDLHRRDFTINAMAIELVGTKPGQLIDLHNGEQDLMRGSVRILHDESFQDDATRALRAVRYAGRLEFRIERQTAATLRRDRGYLDSISGTRLRHEFERIALEEDVTQILTLGERYSLLESVHPALTCTGRTKTALRKLVDVPVGYRDEVLFCVLLADASGGEIADVIGRLAMTNRQAATIAGFLALKSDTALLAASLAGHGQFVELFETRPVGSVWACALVGTATLAKRAKSYLREWRFVRARLRGDDVLRLGVERGPKVGLALRALRAAKIEGRVKSLRDEEAFVRDLALGGTS